MKQRRKPRLKDVVAAILEEIKISVGSFVGYRELRGQFMIRHNIRELKNKTFLSARKSNSRGKTESTPRLLK